MSNDLPKKYSVLTFKEKRECRDMYIQVQERKCYYCKTDLFESPSQEVLNKPINLRLFPIGFLDHPIHLHHSHKTDLTIGVVHAYCNAVLWQYEKE